jgi:putative heme utilization carrier protein HutX
MTALAETATTERPTLAARLASNADGILEQIAQEYGVSTFEVVRNLPGDHASIVPGEHFGDIMEALTGWGAVLFIVHTPDIVLECEGPLPPGTFGRGYFNLNGDSPIGGHIKAENCRHIAFVARPFMGRASRSIQFFNGDGDAMFKIFVRRDAERNLLAEQVALFDQLRETHRVRLAAAE